MKLDELLAQGFSTYQRISPCHDSQRDCERRQGLTIWACAILTWRAVTSKVPSHRIILGGFAQVGSIRFFRDCYSLVINTLVIRSLVLGCRVRIACCLELPWCRFGWKCYPLWLLWRSRSSLENSWLWDQVLRIFWCCVICFHLPSKIFKICFPTVMFLFWRFGFAPR